MDDRCRGKKRSSITVTVRSVTEIHFLRVHEIRLIKYSNGLKDLSANHHERTLDDVYIPYFAVVEKTHMIVTEESGVGKEQMEKEAFGEQVPN